MTAKASAAIHPLGRIGEPEEVASAIRWFLSPEQGWVTGQVLAVDFGLSSVQPRMNALWSPLFFGLTKTGLAFAEIVPLWAAVGGALVLFWRVRPLAGLKLIPYLIWITFAAALNFAIWQLNA